DPRMTRRASIGVAVLIAIACALPFVVSNYRTFQLQLLLVYPIALLGLNILTGYNGQISLGHGAFYAIGAYTAAVLMDRLGAPYWATIPAAGAVCLVAGFLFGLPALRLEGLYLALATFALGVSMPQLLKYHHLEKWTGGVQGIVIAKPEPPAFLLEAGLQMNPDQWLYFFALAVAAVRIVVGGLASISGALYGALFIQFVPNVADEISKAAPWAIFGLFLIGFVYLMPSGVAGAVRMLLVRLMRKGAK